jgi:4-nitrophenyl phosphatase
LQRDREILISPPACHDDRVSDSPAVILLDLDGVVWLSHQPIAGSVDAIAALRAAGHRVLFVTNNSAPRLAAHEAALAAIGDDAVGAVVTSAMAAAHLVSSGERVLVAGGEGVVEAVTARGATVVDGGECDAVVVGFHRDFDYDGLRRAATAVIAGARLIGTNDDATYPTPDGPIPGGGAILAAVRVAGGSIGEVAGKPHLPMARLVRSMIGDDAAASAVMVGDRPETDGLFAGALGCRYAHVESGVTPPGTLVSPTPEIVAADLAEVASSLLA